MVVSVLLRDRARARGYERYRHEFAKLIWQLASPKWAFDDATFARSAASLDNPDHVSIVVHNYRWRLGLADGEPTYDDLERRLARVRHFRADDHARGGCERRAHPDPSRLCQAVLGQIRAPGRSGEASGITCPGSPAGLRPSGRRRRRLLTDVGLVHAWADGRRRPSGDDFYCFGSARGALPRSAAHSSPLRGRQLVGERPARGSVISRRRPATAPTCPSRRHETPRIRRQASWSTRPDRRANRAPGCGSARSASVIFGASSPIPHPASAAQRAAR